jgi:ABC-type transport system involved in multi-copper enzyme maturation permease subunit
MSGVSIATVTRSEWVKFRSVRSTLYNVLAIFVLSIGLGTLIAFAYAHNYAQHEQRNPGDVVDPLTIGLAGIFFAQFVIGVLGSLFITSEYSTGLIRTSFAAVPRRWMMIVGKLAVMLTSVLVISELITFGLFFISQAIFRSVHTNPSPPYLSLSSPGALRGVFLAGIYLVLLGALGFGIGMILRRVAASITVFVVILLVLPILLDILPSNWGNPILRWMPSKLGDGMRSLNQASGTYSPWLCVLVMLGYVAVIIGIGMWLLQRRDA